MSTIKRESESTPQATSTDESGGARRPYVKPGFQVSAAFERQALACSGCLNLAPAPPAFCSLRS
jgi:hypothetical protein